MGTRTAPNSPPASGGEGKEALTRPPAAPLEVPVRAGTRSNPSTGAHSPVTKQPV